MKILNVYVIGVTYLKIKGVYEIGVKIKLNRYD